MEPFKTQIEWLLEGDVSIQYQVHRDLLGDDRKALQKRISTEGWGAQFLSKRNEDGHWGTKFYHPKWTSSHYTLLDLRNLNIAPNNKLIQETIQKIITFERGDDGGINPATSGRHSDVCINGMFLNYACYFQIPEKQLHPIVDFLLSQIMPDGAFNCRLNSSPKRPVHSSFHTTLSALEGITEYEKNGYTYRLEELRAVKKTAIELLLCHQLFRSDRTGKIIHKNFLRLSYPRRWKYDILSALDYFQYAETPWDDRMQAAVNVLLEKQNKNGTWNVQAKHPGMTHFDMEKAGQPSRWNTLRVLRIFLHFDCLPNFSEVIKSKNE